MSIAAGLVGLPNVGKSTLFNALTKSSIPAENYPFCTIDPHLAYTPVPDERMIKLKNIYNSEEIIPATVQFVDIAGLVKGAASGQGLGNQFLSHIREVDLIVHVLRCFEDNLITHTEVSVNPLRDFDIIITELMLKDLESIEKRKSKLTQLIKANKQKPNELKELIKEQEIINEIEKALNDASPTKVKELVAKAQLTTLPLLSSKNFLIVANVDESEIADKYYEKNHHFQSLIKQFGEDRVIPISAKLEADLLSVEEKEAHEIAKMMGLKESGLEKIIKKTYQYLDLITFFTCGPKEIHAWPIKNQTNVKKAAGEIHSDLEKGFICSEVFNCNDLFINGSFSKLKDGGKLRTEGQEYIVQDGDILNIRFNI